MKRLLILGAIFVASVSSAQAIECASERPAVRSGHWYYRIIDERKCWYEGQSMLPKSLLHWPDASLARAQAEMPAQAKMPAQAEMRATDGREFVDPEDGSCCWPPPGDDNSFESRWRALGLKPEN